MEIQSKLVSSLRMAVAAALLLAAMPAAAHCDGLDGPVVAAARQALDSRDVSPALAWVKPGDEATVRDAFRRTLDVRRLNASAKELADQAFFETLVRVHRAGEGEPYSGLKPAGRDLGPALPAGDRAVAAGKVEPVIKLLTETVHAGIEQRYNTMMALRDYRPDDVAAGQKYVQAYVAYIHAVEKVHAAAATDAHGHEEQAQATAHRH